MKIKLKKFFNTQILVNPEKAKILCNQINKIFKIERSVTLDFAEIKGISQLFLYVFFSTIYKKYGKDIKEKFLFINLSALFFEQLNYLKNNYKSLQNRYTKFKLDKNVSYCFLENKMI